MKFLPGILLLMLVLNSLNGAGQVFIVNEPSLKGPKGIDEQPGFIIRNQGESQPVNIRFELYDEHNELIYTGETPLVKLEEGMSTVRIENSKLYKVTWKTADGNIVEDLSKIEYGNYRMTITVSDKMKLRQIATGQRELRVGEPVRKTAKNKATDKLKKPSFNGNAFAELRGSEGYGNQTGLPANYLRVGVNSSLTVAGLPFNVSGQYMFPGSLTTGYTTPFNLSFDINKYRQLLKDKIKKPPLDSVFTHYKDSVENEFNKYSSRLKNPAIKEELLGLAKLDSIKALKEKYLNIDSLNIPCKQYIPSDKDSIAGFCTSIDTTLITDSCKKHLVNYCEKLALLDKAKEKYEWLESKRAYYEGLKSKLDTVSKIKEALKSGIADTISGLSEGAKRRLASVTGKRDSLNTIYEEEKDRLTKKITENKFLRLGKSVFDHISDFSLGVCAPAYSQFTLSGQVLKGGQSGVAYDNFFIKVAGGSLIQFGDRSSVGNNFSGKSLLRAVKLGAGRETGNFLAITHMVAVRDSINIPVKQFPRSHNNLYPGKQQSNQVAAINGRLSLMKGILVLGGELATSFTYSGVPDSLLSQFPTELNSPRLDVRQFWQSIYAPSANTIEGKKGYAGIVEAEINFYKIKGNLKNTFKRTDLNFQSFGTSFMISGYEQLESKYTQLFWKGKIRSSVSVQQVKMQHVANMPDNIRRQLGADLQLRIPKLPVVQLAYRPFVQASDTSRTFSEVMFGSATYQWKWFKLLQTGALTYMRNSFTYGAASNSSTLNNIAFTYTCLFKSIQFSSQVSRGQQYSPSVGDSRLKSNQASLGFNFPENLNHVVGAGTQSAADFYSKYLFYTAMFPLTNQLNISLRGDYAYSESSLPAGDATVSPAISQLNIITTLQFTW